MNELYWLRLLPVDVVCNNIFPFLTVRDLQALDTSYTNKRLRPQLRSIWKYHQWFSLLTSHFLTDYCTQLRTLYLCSYELTDVSIESLCATCRHLLHLSLNSCGCLTDASLVAIAVTYPLLQSLEMRACNFTDAGLEVLVEKCRDLRSVSFCGMVHITNIGLTALWKANPNLLHVRWPMDVAKSLH